MKTDRPTSETDAACDAIYAQGVAHIPLVGFMEDLERQRDEARELLVAESRDAVAIAQKLIDATDQIQELQFALNAERAESANQMLVVEELRRERDEARADAIRWQSIAEGRGRTDDEGAEARADLDDLRCELKNERENLDYSHEQLAEERALADRLAVFVVTIEDRLRRIERLYSNDERCQRIAALTADECLQILDHWKEARKP